MQTWKLEIEYEGTRYRGWQIQKNAKTVQGELMKAAGDYFKAKIELSGSGRTDAGVHAKHQVAHLRIRDMQEDLTPRKLQFALNDRLPYDINILKIQNAPNTFNARFEAVSRWYFYQIATRRTAFGKNYVWWIKDNLNPALMNQAAQNIVGKHNFRSFCEIENETDSTTLTVKQAEVFVDGDMICFRIGAGHFLWKMVRRLTGTLVEVGRGKLSPEALNTFFNKPSDIPAKLTAPPSGLFLEKVCYQGDSIPEEKKAILTI